MEENEQSKNIAELKERAQKILSLLKQAYPDVKGTELNFSNAWELLVATVLAAQTPDARVNEVTKVLFQRYRSIKDYAEADDRELEEILKPINFYRKKAQRIKSIAKIILEKYNGEIPKSIEELTKIPGIGRKTANMVLANALNVVEGITVDTHVMRLANRFKLTTQKDRNKIEKELMEIIPKEEWFDFSNLLIAHGKRVCSAKKPKCEICVIRELCPSAQTTSE
ncbi:MAG: endonuclease III [archaeon YNP-LCB-003-016]|uniref:endonuclease III n=1 Tax=Candidatus Culexarchaeum yellowstonense TaxID=2928963 RepID=UPI0026F09E3F|nr:endonuclease III [Candidatus Culexarchaeum yellowstonense]MCR6690802.1 endonuclease III [Candidatus Culexarchaeum yellowstonense]